METNNNAPRKRINVQELESKLLYATRQAHTDFQQFREMNIKNEISMKRMRAWLGGLMICSLIAMASVLYVRYECTKKHHHISK